VEKILEAVKAGEHQNALHIALFSATMPEPILKVVRKHIGDAEIIVDSAPEDEKPLVDQFCILIKREDKLEALRRIIDSAAEFYGLIFCATKVETDELARRLVEAGYPAEAIHGDLSQEIRERTLRRFRLRRHGSRHNSAIGGEPAILVATDVAARGLDIENLSHVINWDLPGDRETYVHRIGRTARAGKRGIAVSLATLSEREKVHRLSRTMEKTLGSGILWLKVPSVKAVMKAFRRRIASAVVAALPDSAGTEFSAGTEVPAETQFPTGAELPAGTQFPTGTELPATIEDSHDKGIVSVEETGTESQPASPYLAKVCRNLIDRLGAEKAVEALVSLSYGAFLDPGRYGPVTEFSEDDFKEPAKGASRRGERGFGRRAAGFQHGQPEKKGRAGMKPHRESGVRQSAARQNAGRESAARQSAAAEGFSRVYVGRGKKHDVGAREIASLLMRAGGVPSRLVDEIEMKDYCSFATLPADAARRACASSRKEPSWPVIRFAN
jgi:ATP-dependent RNA helicase DeaD